MWCCELFQFFIWVWRPSWNGLFMAFSRPFWPFDNFLVYIDGILCQIHLWMTNFYLASSITVFSSKFANRISVLPRNELRRCVRLVFGSAMSDRTFADFWNKIAIKCYFRTSYPVLEHLFLLQNDLSCFRTSYFVNTLKMLKNCWKNIENLRKKN